MSQVIFVYGTLKQGFPNHRHLEGQRYLGIAKTEPKYVMYRYGHFPAMVEADPGDSLVGELYEVDDQAIVQVDRLEGVDRGLFERRSVSLLDLTLVRLPLVQKPWEALSSRTVEAYFFRGNVNGAARCGDFWSSR